MNTVIVGLGSNIEPEENIQKARAILAQKYNVLAESYFEVTKPVGEIPQADFINGAVLLETELGVEQLKAALKNTESDLGRKETSDQKGGPRTIDLDIVTWNRSIIDQDFYKRDYLKKSVLELIPDLKY